MRSYGVSARLDRRFFCQQATAAGMFRLPAFLPTGYSSRHVHIAGFSANRLQLPARSYRWLFCQQDTAAAGMFRSPAFLPTGYSSWHVQIAGFPANRIPQKPACSESELPAFLPTGYSSRAGFSAIRRQQPSRHVQIAGFSANRIQQPACSNCRLFCQQDTAAGMFRSTAFLPTIDTAAVGMFRSPAFLPTGYSSNRHVQIAGFPATRIQQLA